MGNDPGPGNAVVTAEFAGCPMARRDKPTVGEAKHALLGGTERLRKVVTPGLVSFKMRLCAAVFDNDGAQPRRNMDGQLACRNDNGIAGRTQRPIGELGAANPRIGQAHERWKDPPKLPIEARHA